MNGMRALTLVAVAAGAAAGVAPVNNHADHYFAAAMAPRDGCPDLPKLCTDHAMIHGVATTLTYLCPEPAQVATTVEVTITITTTVTPNPTGSLPTGGLPTVAPVPPKVGSPVDEPTTTSTVKSTLTEHTTITLHRSDVVTKLSLTPPVITWSFSQGVPPARLTAPAILSSFSEGVPPQAPEATAATPSLTLPFATWSFPEGVPIIQGPTATLSTGNGTSSEVSVTQSWGNSTIVAPTAIYSNSSTDRSYTIQTHDMMLRRNQASETATATTMGMASEHKVSSVALFLGLAAAAFLL